MEKSFEDFGIHVDRQGEEIKLQCPECQHTRRKHPKDRPLCVNTAKGVWNCKHCGWAGTLKAGTKDRSDPNWSRTPVWTKPDYVPKTAEQKFYDYFATRGISRAVVERNRINRGQEWIPALEHECDVISFPFYMGGEVINIKHRSANKKFAMVKGAKRVFYGLDDLKGESIGIIVEGEFDKLAFEMAGFKNAISVPNGSPSLDAKDLPALMDFIEHSLPAIEHVKTWYIAVDNDGPGKRMQEELARRLGRAKCYHVEWPEGCKDANDVLLCYGADAIAEAISQAQPFPVEGIHSVIEMESEILDYMENGLPPGLSTGWAALDEYYTPFPGQWTLVTGIPANGKSEWTNSLFVNMAKLHGTTFGLFTPENQPIAVHAAMLAAKYLGKPAKRATEEERRAAIRWVHEHFIYVLPEDDMSLGNVLEMAEVLVERKGITGFIIDPWNELEHNRPAGMAETDYVSLSLTQIRKFSRNRSVHTWVIAHPTKMEKLSESSNQYKVPTPYDVSGSANWRNKADNSITIHRDDEHGITQVHIQKIRFEGWLGKKGMVELIFDPERGGVFVELKDAPVSYSGRPRSDFESDQSLL